MVRVIASGAVAFDPATLSLDGWWRASFGGSPWANTASAGTSGSNGTLVTSGTVPSVGTAVNSLTPASFNGSTQALVTGTAVMTDLISTSALTIVMLINAAASVAAAADYYDDPCLFSDNNGNLAMSFASSGVRAGLYFGGSKQTVAIALATGTPALVAMRYDGADVKCRVSQASGTTDATPVASAGASPGAAPYIGRNYTNAKHFQGDILEIMTSKTVLSDANLVSIRSYFNSRYALALT